MWPRICNEIYFSPMFIVHHNVRLHTFRHYIVSISPCQSPFSTSTALNWWYAVKGASPWTSVTGFPTRPLSNHLKPMYWYTQVHPCAISPPAKHSTCPSFLHYVKVNRIYCRSLLFTFIFLSNLIQICFNTSIVWIYPVLFTPAYHNVMPD